MSRSKSSRKRTGELVSPADLAAVVGLPVLAAAAGLVPARIWRSCASAAVPFVVSNLPKSVDALRARIDEVGGDRLLACPAREIPDRLAESLVEAEMYLLAARRRGCWPRVALTGEARIDTALACRRGAVLWNGYFAFDSLMTKMALHRAGYRVSHLSHPGHGFSSSRFGMRVLNRVARRLEDRFLGERILLSLDGPVGAMRTLQQRLRRNGLVSITARNASQRPVETAFLDGSIRLSTGAPDLAHATGAALLPAFTSRAAPDRFEMVVEEPISIDASQPRRNASLEAIAAYARRLEPYVRRWPDQWLGWLDP